LVSRAVGSFADFALAIFLSPTVTSIRIKVLILTRTETLVATYDSFLKTGSACVSRNPVES
jgi:hypothetical protein